MCTLVKVHNVVGAAFGLNTPHGHVLGFAFRFIVFVTLANIMITLLILDAPIYDFLGFLVKSMMGLLVSLLCVMVLVLLFSSLLVLVLLVIFFSSLLVIVLLVIFFSGLLVMLLFMLNTI